MTADLLIVDDKAEVRNLLARGLEREGYGVTAASGHAAIEALHDNDFDVVVADPFMSGMGGFQLLRAVREGAPETEVVLTTPRAKRESAATFLKQGAYDLVEKPFHMFELTDAVARAIERRAARIATSVHEQSLVLFVADESERLPETIADLAASVMGADDVSVMLAQPNGNLYVSFCRGSFRQARNDAVVPLGERVAGRVAAQRRPALIHRDLAGNDRFGQVDSMRPVRSSIVYPLFLGDQLLGVLNMNRVTAHRPFREADLDRAALLARHVARALGNSALVRQLVASERLLAIGQVAAGVAHEVNNPLAYVVESASQIRQRADRLMELDGLIAGSASLPELRASWRRLRGAALIEELRHAAADAHEGSMRIAEIVKDLRTLTAAHKGEATPVDVNEAVRLGIRILGVDLNRSAKLVTSLGEGTQVMGHIGRLAQAIVGLLSFALRAHDGQREITLMTERQGHYVTIHVADDGPAIPRASQRRIFEPFFSTHADGAQANVGLNVSHDILRGYGGELRLESSTARATTFLATLPAADAMEVAHEPGLRFAGSERKPGRKRILFVDDEPTLLRAYARAFGREHEVVLAESGAQALARIAESPDFTLIVSDVVMPGISGIDLFHEVAKLHPELRPRFVFATGSVADGEAQAALGDPSLVVLEKPFDFEIIERLLQGGPLE